MYYKTPNEMKGCIYWNKNLQTKEIIKKEQESDKEKKKK